MAGDAGRWSEAMEEECVEEMLRRDREWSPWRADRLRLPVKVSESLEDGDWIQCFHDGRTGFCDWAKVTRRGRCWVVHLVEWRSRDGVSSPPQIHSLGALLDYYAELRINTRAARAPRSERDAPAVLERIVSKQEGETWIDKSNEACYVELARRCRENAGLRLRFRLPGVAKAPAAGDMLQMFHDRLTGFASYGILDFDTTHRSHFVRVFRERSGSMTHSHLDTTELASVDVPVGAVLDQHAEIRVYAVAPQPTDRSRSL